MTHVHSDECSFQSLLALCTHTMSGKKPEVKIMLILKVQVKYHMQQGSGRHN